MFPQFGVTAESLSKASSLVLRIGTDAHLYDDPDDVSIAPLLDSRFDSEKCEALKRLLALIAQGADVSNFFPQVVKNVASPSLEVKKLVYLYLLHYAEKRPSEALLSINCFQKDLSDTNPLVRAWALRAMAGIRLHVVAPLVSVAIRKCSRDPSPYVRKCAAHAIPKLFDLHQEENDSLEELVSVLLNDHSPGVVGAAAIALKSVCPNNLSLVGKSFRRLCETLPDVEEWGQIVLMEMLLRYVVARHGLVRESVMFTSSSTSSSQAGKSVADATKSFSTNCDSVGGDACDLKLNTLMYKYYVEGQEGHLSQSTYTGGDEDKLKGVVPTSIQNDDVKLLLQCTSPLLWSQNSAVVLAAVGVHWIMSSKEDIDMIVKPLLFILRSCPASKYVVLCNLQVFGKVNPLLFAPYFEDFFICNSDSYQIRALKLDILSTIATESSIPIILEEFQDYIRDSDRRFVADTVSAIGLCAQKLPFVANVCLEGLLSLTLQESSTPCSGQMDGEAAVLVQAVMSIKAIIKQNPTSHEKMIIRLARNLDVIKEPSARASIVWIVGEYNSIGQIIPKIVPSILRYLARCFISEELETKHQILTTTAKVVLCAQEEDLGMFRKILSYIIELAKYDMNYDLRDRARFIENLIPCHITSQWLEYGTDYLLQSGSTHRELVDNIFRGRISKAGNPSKDYHFYLPGSLSQIVLHAAPGYGPLPKPSSLLDTDLDPSSMLAPHTKVQVGNSDSFESNDPDSESSIEESGSSYDSQHPVASSADSEGTEFASDADENGQDVTLEAVGVDDSEPPLVQISDGLVADCQTHQSATENTTSFSADLAEMMSNTALESWLDEQPSFSLVQKSGQQSSARISINDPGFNIKPKLYTLLDPTNGNGLMVDYSFSSEISTISPLLVCVEVLFRNCSTESLTKIVVEDGESDGSLESRAQVFEKSESPPNANDVPSILPMEEIASLDPGQTKRVVLQVRFHHHLLPLKLATFCNGKKHLAKLWPDIGYFVRPLSMSVEGFLDKESQLRGMFECSKRCTYKDHIAELDHELQISIHIDKILVVSRSLASKVLSNANVYLVSMDMPVSFNIDDASGLCLRFSGETLNSLKPCLVTVLIEGKCSEPLSVTIKVNCEETIFALNLLNRVAAFLG